MGEGRAGPDAVDHVRDAGWGVPRRDTLVVIQARTGSTRLPGKVLKEVAGRPMLRFQIERLRSLSSPIVVATSTLAQDDAIVELAVDAGVGVVRGSPEDVLDRFVTALDEFQPEVVVRLTGDCPLSDPRIVADAVALHSDDAVEYASNLFPRSFPKGLDVEAVSASALRAAAADANRKDEREHVTPFVYRHPERFRMANLMSGRDLGREWWTVDRPEDLQRIREIVAELDDPIGAGWLDILEVAGERECPSPGAVRLVAEAHSPAGESPWSRTWRAERGGVVVGRATLSVADGVGHRTLDVPASEESQVRAALEELLVLDLQEVR